jgi:hypothetical protein
MVEGRKDSDRSTKGNDAAGLEDTWDNLTGRDHSTIFPYVLLLQL